MKMHIHASSSFFALASISTLSYAIKVPSPVAHVPHQARAASLPTITTEGNAFWSGSDRFYIRGVDYQPGGSSNLEDPLADPTICQRDIPYFQQLGINTVRVYAVDNSQNHDTCMNALAAAGIYVALDVNTPNYSIDRDNPKPSYNAAYLQYIFATMDVFSQYTNTLLFFSGNEIISADTETSVAPWAKAVVRDMKQYQTARSLRQIPIGYSAADIAGSQYNAALYFNCGNDTIRSDFFAFNDYSLCSPDPYEGSQWAQKVQQYSDYGLPLFLSEYGCHANPPRTFIEVPALYNNMTAVYSGGLVYEYAEEANNFGLVNISGNTVTPNTDFTNLENQLKANPAPSGDGGARKATSANDCPPPSDSWNVTAYPGTNLPTQPTAASTLFANGAGPGAGFAGPGSQDAGSDAEGEAAPASSGSGSSSTTTSDSSTASSTSAAAASATSSKAGAVGPLLLVSSPVFSSLWSTALAVLASGILGASLML